MPERFPWWIFLKLPGRAAVIPALKYKNLAPDSQYKYRQNEKKTRKNSPRKHGIIKKNPASLNSRRDAGYDGTRAYFMRTIFRTEVNLSLVIRTKYMPLVAAVLLLVSPFHSTVYVPAAFTSWRSVRTS